MKPDREARLKPAPGNASGSGSHQLKLVADRVSAEADSQDDQGGHLSVSHLLLSSAASYGPTGNSVRGATAANLADRPVPATACPCITRSPRMAPQPSLATSTEPCRSWGENHAHITRPSHGDCPPHHLQQPSHQRVGTTRIRRPRRAGPSTNRRPGRGSFASAGSGSCTIQVAALSTVDHA